MLEKWVVKHHKMLVDGRSVDTCVEEFKKRIGEHKIILYGAGTTGKTLAEQLRANGIDIAFFIDRIVTGENIFKSCYLKKVNLNNYIVIAAVNSNNMIDIIRDLREENINLQLEDGFSLLGIFRTCKCIRDFESGKHLDVTCCIACPNRYEYCGVLLRSMKKEYSFTCENEPHPINRIDVDFGCACNLKCKYCSIGIPHINKPRFYKVESVKKDIDKVADTLPFLQFCYVAGGEPSLHPNFAELINYMLGKLRYAFICVCVNAVDTPPQKALEVLRNPRVIVCASKYAVLEKKRLSEIEKTLRTFKENGIKVYLKEAVTWFDNNDCAYYEDPEHSLEERYDACFMRRIFDWTIAEGMMHICSHDYFGALTGLIPRNVHRINIHDYSRQELLDKFSELRNVKYIEACKYCKAPFHNGIVGAGEQM